MRNSPLLAYRVSGSVMAPSPPVDAQITALRESARRVFVLRAATLPGSGRQRRRRATIGLAPSGLTWLRCQQSPILTVVRWAASEIRTEAHADRLVLKVSVGTPVLCCRPNSGPIS